MKSALGDKAVRFGDEVSDDYYADESLHAAKVSPGLLVIPTSTAQVADIVRIAAETRTPVTARGAGTGLSGACIPDAEGVLVSFEAMNSILEVDERSHAAVVQPGVTLAELDVAAAAAGLVFPVHPGTDSASLGGNLSTNAGGMAAVRYGVTRHHVLGAEAVLGTGEVVRSGGRFVKVSSGYDLTQLLVGSEGTLALITEATLKLHPRLTATTTLLAAFESVDDVTAVIPELISTGVEPTTCEYIDRGTMKGLRAQNDLTLAIPAEVEAKTGAYLVVVLEGRIQSRVDEDAELVAELLANAGAFDVYGLLSGQGAELLAARENAFWLVKAAGADDLIDLVVPRQAIPEYIRRTAEIGRAHGTRVFGCGHAGDGNIHFSIYQSDEEIRSATIKEIFAMGLSLGGAISGEHGIGRAKKSYFQALEDPAKLALQRRIKAAFDPAGILNPGCIFDP
jgi:glycolate oxidase